MDELRILVIDDDRDLAESMADYLQLDDCNVDIRLAGQAGLIAAEDDDYDLILMDVMLPDISGIEVMRAIRKSRPSARVLLMSGLSSDDLDNQNLGHEIPAVMTKPVDLDQLSIHLAAIREAKAAKRP